MGQLRKAKANFFLEIDRQKGTQKYYGKSINQLTEKECPKSGPSVTKITVHIATGCNIFT